MWPCCGVSQDWNQSVSWPRPFLETLEMGRNLLPKSLRLFGLGAIITCFPEKETEVLYLLWNHTDGTDVIPVQMCQTQKPGTLSFMSMCWMVLVDSK